MQSVLDNLCRCFGTDVSTRASISTQPLETFCSGGDHELGLADSSRSGPATPGGKRRTRSLTLQDKQWDALFAPTSNSVVSAKRLVSSRRSSDVAGAAGPVESDKLQAASKRPHVKRKRRQTRRDDIFRTKKHEGRGGPTGPPNPFGRFLSKHPVLANSLCFATPVKDSQSAASDEEPSLLSGAHNSMVSDTNTLNTVGDETVTSTLYYETTKLAGLQQMNPPMPLFNRFQVAGGDEIHRIVATHSHSSMPVRQYMYNWKQVVEFSDEEAESDEEGNNDPDDSPPAMIHSSSESTRSSHEKHQQSPQAMDI
jgi:hypothetical protein